MNCKSVVIQWLLSVVYVALVVGLNASNAACQDPPQNVQQLHSVLQRNENQQQEAKQEQAEEDVAKAQQQKTTEPSDGTIIGEIQIIDPASDKFKELMQRYEQLGMNYLKQVQNADPKDELRVWMEANPMNEMAGDFLALIDEFPDSPSAFESLSLLLSQGVGDDKQKAVCQLINRFVDDERIVSIMGSIASGAPSPCTEKWLQQIALKSSNPRIQAKALQSELDYIHSVTQLRKYLNNQPDFAVRAGHELVSYLNSYDMEKAQLEKINVLNRLSKEFSEIETEVHGRTYGELADHELYIVNHLSVGKAALEIEGKDLTEDEFKLSDYRGKVVLVLFWGNWSTNSTKMYTQLRSLAKKLDGKPFAIIGVNTDRSRIQILKTAKLLQLDWRNFWDFRKHGPISTAWKVEQYPAVYVLDDKGIIRFKDVDGTELDAAITSLMSEMGYAVDLADHSDGELPTPTLIDETSPSASDEASGSGSEP